MLKERITIKEIKRIFSNKELKILYLTKLFESKEDAPPIENTIAKIDNQIISTWEYELSKNILRELFKQSEKYRRCRDCGGQIQDALQSWSENNIGEFSWPFSAMNFDNRVHQINRMEISENEKDSILCSDVKRFRRIKDINSKRNDYIEYLIFEHNENVIPTFTNSKGIDFYINGEPYDQKASKSAGGDFIREYGEDYREIALNHPELVAKSLYEHQDKSRFGDEPRLFVVYLDSDISAERTKNIILNTNFMSSIEIEFDYKHSRNNIQHHSTHCFIVLLHN